MVLATLDQAIRPVGRALDRALADEQVTGNL